LRFDAILGLGTNMGDKPANIERAIALIAAPGDVRVLARSPLYRTAAWGKTDQDWFVNACIGVATDLSARDLLARCQDVEARMGRERKEHWGPRVIDVDILTYRDATIRERDLTVPHPLIAQRAFVLVPLADIAPDVEIGGRSIADLLRDIDPREVVVLDRDADNPAAGAADTK